MENKKNNAATAATAKAKAAKLTERASGTQVVKTRVNVNPCCYVSNFVDHAILADKNAELVRCVELYKDAYSKAHDKDAQNVDSLLILADECWQAAQKALAEYNRVYKALQLDALRAAGTTVYVASPMRREKRLQRDKDGMYKGETFIDVPVYPSEFSTAQEPQFSSENWKANFERLINACGYVFAGDLAFATREGTSSRKKIKELMSDCIKSVFGADCKYSPRAEDVNALMYSVASRDFRNVNSFKQTSRANMEWAIIDTIGSAMMNTKYHFAAADKNDDSNN